MIFRILVLSGNKISFRCNPFPHFPGYFVKIGYLVISRKLSGIFGRAGNRYSPYSGVFFAVSVQDNFSENNIFKGKRTSKTSINFFLKFENNNLKLAI